MVNILNPILHKNLNLNKETTNNRNNEKSNKEILGKSFEEILNDKQNIKFSAHAQKRINLRNININKEELQKIQKGMEKLREKGCKDSVVLADDIAYVVSVKNNTVITVLDNNESKDNVFTNIDSMIIV